MDTSLFITGCVQNGGRVTPSDKFLRLNFVPRPSLLPTRWSKTPEEQSWKRACSLIRTLLSWLITHVVLRGKTLKETNSRSKSQFLLVSQKIFPKLLKFVNSKWCHSFLIFLVPPDVPLPCLYCSFYVQFFLSSLYIRLRPVKETVE